jgi:hypothetical protein
MKRNPAVFSVLLGVVLFTSMGCFKQATAPGFVEKAEAQTTVTKVSQTQTVAGLSLDSPFTFVRANERLDTGLRDLSEDIRSNIVSYESWDATAADGTQKIVVNRITYRKGRELNLDAATEGSVEDIMLGLENACKPQYKINSQMVANLPGRYLSLSCNLPQEGPVYVESITFADKETLWFVQVAFDSKAKLAAAKSILNSVRIKTSV